MTPDGLTELAAAYEGLEALESFSAESLERYRAALLVRTNEPAAFIAARHPAGGAVLEIGSGSGRLLVALAATGVMQRAVGLEIANSRAEFARRWTDDAGLEEISFEVADALTHDVGQALYGTVACITSTFSYFDAIAPGSATRLAERVLAALVPGGLFVLEVYAHPEYRRLLEATGGEARIWQELATDDPWRFYLSHLTLDGDVLTHTKTFVHRTNGTVDSGRRERLVLYTPESLTLLLDATGFVDVETFGDWTGHPYGGDSRLVVTARRPRA